VIIANYPDFRFDVDVVNAAITPRTKMILLNSPANPTGVCPDRQQIQAIAELAKQRGICLVSDEIYSRFCYDGPHVSPAEFNDQTIVVDGFSKPYAMTGLRVGYVHGPAEIIETMTKLQQLTFVCAPAPVQWGCLAALDVDIQEEVDRYRQKRDYLLAELANDYEIAHPGGAFYVFPKLPWGDGDSFQSAAIAGNLLIIPGKIFSRHDTHFRISYAVDDPMLERGIQILKSLARNPIALQSAGT
jgi:aspartate aminotransferase/aminotransferase